MQEYFNADEMSALLEELDEKNKDVNLDDVMDEEMEASQRRVSEILEKHRDD